VIHELTERLRDRWVLVATALFGLLAIGIALYGRSAGDAAGVVTGPSLVTLAAFLVPLVALVLGHDAIVGERERHTLGLLLSLPVRRGEVLVAKFLGRLLALVFAVVVGLGSAGLVLGGGQQAVVWQLMPSTVLMGASFLSLGVMISAITRRHATAASLAVVAWFLLVLFWDLALLASLVVTDGAIGQSTVQWAVVFNPAGLYRLGALGDLMGESTLADMGLVVALPGPMLRAAIWATWIALPLGMGAAALSRPRAVTC
jgi:Cu-processing system permease protein